MLCNQCGKDNPDGAKFCKYCGNLLHNNLSKSRQWETKFIDLLKYFMREKTRAAKIYFGEKPRNPSDQECPHCGSNDTQIIQKNITDVKTKGYNVGNGCCGLCLLGPFGLLCGMIGTGTKVKTSNETWWHCKNCGQQYISQASVLEKAEIFANGLFGNSLIAGAIFSMFYYWGFESRLAAFIIMLMLSIFFPLGMISVNYDLLNKELGYSIIDVLPGEKRKKYGSLFFKSPAIIIMATLLAVPILESFM